MDREEGTRKTAEEIAKLSAEYIKNVLKLRKKMGLKQKLYCWQQ